MSDETEIVAVPMIRVPDSDELVPLAEHLAPEPDLTRIAYTGRNGKQVTMLRSDYHRKEL